MDTSIRRSTPHTRRVFRCYRHGTEITAFDLGDGTGFCAQCGRDVRLSEYWEANTRLGRWIIDAQVLGLVVTLTAAIPASVALIIVLLRWWGADWSDIAVMAAFYGGFVVLLENWGALWDRVRYSVEQTKRRRGSGLLDEWT